MSIVKADAGADPPGATKVIALPLPESVLLGELLSQMATATISSYSQAGTPSPQVPESSTSSTVSTTMTVQTANLISSSLMPVTLVVQSSSMPSFTALSRVLSGTPSIHSLSILPASSLGSSVPQSSDAATAVSADSSTMSIHTTQSGNAVSIPTESAHSNIHQSYTHTPVFWIALVLGTLACIAIICTLVAWWIRFRSAKKRRTGLDVSAIPWSEDSNETGHDFEAKRIANFMDAIGSDSVNLAGDLSGDRDVGEPKRGSVYHLPASIVQRGTAGPFASSIILPRVLNCSEDTRNGSISNSTSLLSSDGPYLAARLPRHLSSGFSIQENARTLGPLQVANMVGEDDASPPISQDIAHTSLTEFGNPRKHADGGTPRFLGLKGDALNKSWSSSQAEDSWSRPYPWEQAAPALVRQPPKHIPTLNWDHLPPLPMPGDDQSQLASYGGSRSSASLAMTSESHLSNAFDTGAGVQPGVGYLKDEHFVPGHRHSSRELNARSEEFVEWEMERARRKTPVSNRADILHFHDKDLGVVDPPWSTIELDDNGIQPSDSRTTKISQAPLVIRKKSRAVAMERPRKSLYTRYGEAENESNIADTSEPSQDEYRYCGNEVRTVPAKHPRTAQSTRMNTVRTYGSKDDITRRRNREPMARPSANSSASYETDISWFGLTERSEDKQASKVVWRM